MPRRSVRARTTDSAADADSFITSPSWPVRISWPLPGTSVDFDLQQVAADFGPGQARDQADFVLLLGAAEVVARTPRYLSRFLRRDVDALGFLPSSRLRAGQRDFLDHLAADLGDLALEVAHAGFARVVAHDVADRALGDLQLRPASGRWP